MLEDSITKDDIGCWFETRGGEYYKINTVDFIVRGVYRNMRTGSRHKKDGRCYLDPRRPSEYDLVRKLDPIEVNLLRLNHARK